MKEINLRVIIKSGEAKAVAPLGPILGQYQINIIQFCNEFNIKTQYMLSGVPLIVQIIRFDDKEYLMRIKKPSVSFLIDQFVAHGEISAERLFDIVRLNSFFIEDTILQNVFCVFGSLRSKKVKIC